MKITQSLIEYDPLWNKKVFLKAAFHLGVDRRISRSSGCESNEVSKQFHYDVIFQLSLSISLFLTTFLLVQLAYEYEDP